jgi:hypothetical protein
MADRITERDVEAIYRTSQRKIKTYPRYAEAFKRVCDLVMQDDDQRDQNALQQAFDDLMMIEFDIQFGIEEGA